MLHNKLLSSRFKAEEPPAHLDMNEGKKLTSVVVFPFIGHGSEIDYVGRSRLLWLKLM